MILVHLAVLLSFSLLTALALLVVFRVRSLKMMKTEAQSLEATRVRLQEIISELMQRANDADLAFKFLPVGSNSSFSQRLEKACEDLVLLGDAITVIDRRIDQKRFKEAKKDLLISLDVAEKIRLEIGELSDEIKRIC